MLHISTRGEYGVRVMINLARHYDQGLRSLNEIAEDEGLPMQYLEQFIKKLRDSGLVTSVRGAQGGYQLTRPPAEIRMSAVMEALEGKVEVYACLSDKDPEKLTCDLGRTLGNCSTRLLWSRLNDAIWQTLDGITLAELGTESAPVLGAMLSGSAPHDCG
jgi:Rrf2 family transcriptional regulator, cysteine metabolism repressor